MRLCPECSSTDIYYEAERGQLVCRSCGLVLEDKGQLPYESELSAEVDRLGRRQALRLRDEPRRPVRLNSEGVRVRESMERARRLDRAAREAPDGYVVANPQEVMEGGRARYAKPVELPRRVAAILELWRMLDPRLGDMRPHKLSAAAAERLRLHDLARSLHSDPKRALREVRSRAYEHMLARRL